MASEDDFVRLAETLEEGFFADSVLLALQEVLETKKVSTTELELFRKAHDFMTKVENGTKIFEGERLGSEALESAKANWLAMEAWDLSLLSAKQVRPDELFQQTIQTFSELLQERLPSTERLEIARDLFAAISIQTSHVSSQLLTKSQELPTRVV